MSRKIWMLLGIGLIVLSMSVWLLVDGWYKKINYSPLARPFDSLQNSEIREGFRIDAADRYFLYLELAKLGSSDQEREELSCNLQANVLREGAVVWERALDRITVSQSSNSDVSYGLGWFDLTPGSYELIVRNLTDLPYLAPMNPRLTVRVTPAAVVSRMAIQAFVTVLCAAVGLAGLVILIFGVMKKNSNP